nr:nitroreductase [uncultured Clostridium sp.]
MNNPVLKAIADRRSIRAYQPQQITKEQLEALLTAAEQSPSANDVQPWHFSVVQNTDILGELSIETNSHYNREDDAFYGASTVIFLSYSETDEDWACYDCGIAAQTIALAAHSIGLGSVIIGLTKPAFNGERGEYFKNLLKFPDSNNFTVAIAIGIPTATKEAHPIKPNRVDIIT